MGSRVIYIIILLALSLNLFSQEEDDFADDGTTKMGFNVGINYNMIRLRPNNKSIYNDSINFIKTSNSAGYNVSMLFYFPISEKISLKLVPGLVFIRNKIDYSFNPNGDHNENLNHTIVPFPIQMNYYPSSDKKLYLIAGAAYSLMIGNTDKLTTHKLALRSNDFEVDIGIGLDILNDTFIFGPELKYTYGILNHKKPLESIYNDPINSFSFHRISFAFNFI